MKAVIYSKDYCPYCKAAKQLLHQRGITFTEIDIAKQPSKAKEMVQKSQRRTVPQVFFDGEHIGGYEDLFKHFSSKAG